MCRGCGDGVSCVFLSSLVMIAGHRITVVIVTMKITRVNEWVNARANDTVMSAIVPAAVCLLCDFNISITEIEKKRRPRD